jgi:hypothetical protein
MILKKKLHQQKSERINIETTYNNLSLVSTKNTTTFFEIIAGLIRENMERF